MPIKYIHLPRYTIKFPICLSSEERDVSYLNVYLRVDMILSHEWTVCNYVPSKRYDKKYHKQAVKRQYNTFYMDHHVYTAHALVFFLFHDN